jgi:nitrogen fixation NifU-like protein
MESGKRFLEPVRPGSESRIGSVREGKQRAYGGGAFGAASLPPGVYHVSSILIGIGILIAIVLLWFLLTYWLNPQVEAPDGKACITGSCGDTMEISLKFREERVAEAASWTNGCAYSLNCISAVADLAKKKTPDEILEIDPELVQKSVGGLPQEQMHCARLSVETLHAALDNYMQNMRRAGKANSRP